MEERTLKMFGIFLLIVFAIMTASLLYSQHEKYELLRDLAKTECVKDNI